MSAYAPAASACDCGHCTPKITHASDCAVHNAPALPIGECTCGAGYGTGAIVSALMDVAGWLENEKRLKHAAHIRRGIRRLQDLGLESTQLRREQDCALNAIRNTIVVLDAQNACQTMAAALRILIARADAGGSIMAQWPPDD